MSLKDFRQVSSQNQEIDRLSKNTHEFAAQIVQNPLIDGVLLTGVSLTSTASYVPHTLGRVWKGFIVTNKSVLGADVIGTHDRLDNQFALLTASSAVTVDLWLF